MTTRNLAPERHGHQLKLRRVMGDVDMSDTDTKPLAWRPNSWRKSFEPPMSTGQLAEFIATGYVPSVKVHGARYITESPQAFIERHRDAGSAATPQLGKGKARRRMPIRGGR